MSSSNAGRAQRTALPSGTLAENLVGVLSGELERTVSASWWIASAAKSPSEISLQIGCVPAREWPAAMSALAVRSDAGRARSNF